jgi:DNA-binding transcriptional regulator YdaS (Cro superfamily)
LQSGGALAAAIGAEIEVPDADEVRVEHVVEIAPCTSGAVQGEEVAVDIIWFGKFNAEALTRIVVIVA